MERRARVRGHPKGSVQSIFWGVAISIISCLGWSDEAYPVFHHTTYETSSANSVAFAIERAALPLFGFANFGSLLIGAFLLL